MSYPLVMTEEYWRNSPFSIARFYGQVEINGAEYVIVDKTGRDIFELSEIAEKEGRQKAIEPGEPCDLCRVDIVPLYRALGRERVLKILNGGGGEAELRAAVTINVQPKRKY